MSTNQRIYDGVSYAYYEEIGTLLNSSVLFAVSHTVPSEFEEVSLALCDFSSTSYNFLNGVLWERIRNYSDLHSDLFKEGELLFTEAHELICASFEKIIEYLGEDLELDATELPMLYERVDDLEQRIIPDILSELDERYVVVDYDENGWIVGSHEEFKLQGAARERKEVQLLNMRKELGEKKMRIEKIENFITSILPPIEEDLKAMEDRVNAFISKVEEYSPSVEDIEASNFKINWNERGYGAIKAFENILDGILTIGATDVKSREPELALLEGMYLKDWNRWENLDSTLESIDAEFGEIIDVDRTMAARDASYVEDMDLSEALDTTSILIKAGVETKPYQNWEAYTTTAILLALPNSAAVGVGALSKMGEATEIVLNNKETPSLSEINGPEAAYIFTNGIIGGLDGYNALDMPKIIGAGMASHAAEIPFKNAVASSAVGSLASEVSPKVVLSSFGTATVGYLVEKNAGYNSGDYNLLNAGPSVSNAVSNAALNGLLTAFGYYL